MTRRIVLAILVVVLLVAGAVMVGGYAYRFGLMQGLSQNSAIVAPDGTQPNGVPAPWFYYGGPLFWHGGWGWHGGFGFLSCLIPLLFFLTLFSVIRGMFWRGHWGWRRGWGPGGPGRMGWDRERGYPSMFEEWHRRMHEGQASRPEGDKS